jgi:fatty-acyl-CoA synthase
MADVTIWTLLAEARTRFGERTAVVEAGHGRTYAELAGAVGARALDWRARGIAPGDRVAVLEVNTGAFLECYFAAAALGAVLVPLNHRLAPAELAAILADAGVRLVTFAPAFAPAVAALRQGASPVEHWCPIAVARAPAAMEAPHEARPDDLAHLYYTSGTTGRPKGVMLTHRNVCVHARVAVEELGIASTDRWGHFAPLFHLADAWATFAVTQVGGTHVMMPRFEPDAALELIDREGVTITNLVPTMLGRMVASPRVGAGSLASLRVVLSGGAPIAPALVRAVLTRLRCDYVQTYGMTETSPYLTLGIVPPELQDLPESELLALKARTGRPFAAVELEVVDHHDQPVPPDDRTVGEIRVRGETVTPGYWNRPDETAQALRGGWLYTGDLAVVDGHGFVNIVDRKKDMILTGGENVYSTEVENALHEHPAVLEAAVYGRPDETWGEIVCAAVVLVPGSNVSPEELVSTCRERIAGYKVPRVIELVDELPKTGSGKISKAALRRGGRAGDRLP